MCIRDRSSSVIEYTSLLDSIEELDQQHLKARCYFNIKDDQFIIDHVLSGTISKNEPDLRGLSCCLLYTSDDADERSSVDLGGRRIIKKQNKKKKQ